MKSVDQNNHDTVAYRLNGNLCFAVLFCLALSLIIILSLINIYLSNQMANSLSANKCELSFTLMVSHFSGTGPSASTVANFDSDNILDLAVVNYQESTTSIFHSNGMGGFTRKHILSNGRHAGTNSIAAGDVNNDKRADLIFVNSNTSDIRIFLGRGNRTFSSPIVYSTGIGSYPLGLALGHLNGDSMLDLVVSDNKTSSLFVLFGKGDGTFKRQTVLPTGDFSQPYAVIINDLNGDTHLDIIVSNVGTNNIGVFLGDGQGNFLEQTTFPTGNYPRALVTADFNQDGVFDIATVNYLEHTISVLLGNGDGTFALQKKFSTGNGSFPYAIDSGDFNRDNIPDLIVANSATNNIGILLGDGDGSFQNQSTISTGSHSHPHDISIGDFNGDNRLDFISINYQTNTIGVFLNTCLKI